MNPEQLIVRIQEGDQRAFRQLVEEHQERVFNTCIGFMGTHQDAQEQTQLAFIKVYEKIDRFEGKSTLSTWIYRIAVNTCLDALRKRKRQQTESIDLHIHQIESNASFDHPGLKMEQLEMADMLYKAVAQLKENQRVAFTLQKIEGLNISEISKIMQATTAAVDGYLFRAKENLRKIINQTKD